jgi:gamma-glutamylcyclotransferase
VTRLGGSVPYFAYGPNIHPGWLRRRVPAVMRLGTGVLPGHRLAFHKRGRDGAGKSNAWRTDAAADRLPGALYRVPVQHFQRLGAAGGGYHTAEVLIESAAGPLTALTWRAEPDEIEDGLRPWEWYVALIRAGAAVHGLPESHRRWLLTVPVVEDPDRARAAIAYAVIDGFADSASAPPIP